MSVSVNGVDVAIATGMSPELAAARELLRQRALALGVLDTDTLTISRLGEVPADDPRTVHLVPGTARALVSSGAGTFLATVKP